MSVKNHEQRRGGPPASFLLSQVGAHAAATFAARLAPLQLSPPHAGILRILSRSGGLSQQELASQLKVHPSALVGLMDQLEKRGFVRRQQKADDRRANELHLTEQGQEILAEIGRIARQHQEALLVSLDRQEREQLTNLLQRIADEQNLTQGVHPGLRGLGSKRRSRQ